MRAPNRPGRGPTPLRRGVVPRATFKDTRPGKSGFPSVQEYEEHEREEDEEHKEDGCKDHNLLLQNLGFHAMSLKTWTWVPILEDSWETNTNA